MTQARYNCGGFDSYHGPCGGVDCASCYPFSRFPDVEVETETEIEVTPEPIGWRCVAADWEPADSGNLWHTPMAFIRHMHRVHGKAPSLHAMNGADRYCYEERRYILRAVYEEIEQVEQDDDDDLSAGDFDEVDLDPAAREFRAETDRYIDEE